MFITQKMILLDVLVLKENVEDVSTLIVKSGFFEPSNFSVLSSDKEKQWTHENVADNKTMILNLQKTANDLKQYFLSYTSLNMSYQKNTTIQNIPAMSNTLRQYNIKKTQLEERYYLIRKQKEEVAVKIAGLRMHLEAIEKQHKNLNNGSAMYSILGLIASVNLTVLEQEFTRFEGELLTEGHVNDSEIVFITIPSNKKEELTAVLEQLYFVNYGLPEEFFGEGISNMMKLGLEYTLKCDQEEMLETELKKLTPVVLSNLESILNSLEFYSKISEVRQSMKQSGHFVLLSGWITAENFRSLKASIQELCGDNYEIKVSGTDAFSREVDIPTKLQNPAIFKPFEQLVTTFGMPNYKEIDPTILFSFFYVLMYGAMFGDVGQGALLFIGGIIGKLLKKGKAFNMIASLMIWVGLSSTIFGFLYGSYFGYESVYYSWVPEPLWISPMHNINMILSYSIIFGIFVIMLSYVLGVINAIRFRDWQGLLFSHKGIVAFLVYLIVLIMGYLTYQQIPMPLALPISLGVLSVFLGFERVWEALIYGHGSVKDWWMGFFDMFEFFLSMITNTLSFVRIGAFALTHAALMMAVFTLRDLAGGDTLAGWITVVLGNLFVIGMEGFIVGIQTLRLEYYEFFIRFFKGTGRVFNPITYKSQ